MPRSSSSRTVVAVVGAAVLLSAVALGATVVAGRTITPAPEPTPIVVPSNPVPTDPPATPVPTPTPSPTPDPSDAPDGHFVVDLDVSDDHDVSVAVDDQSGRIVGVASGQAGDGMSVRWTDIEIVNIDARTLQVTFVGFPQDEVIDLDFAVAAGDGFNLTITQALPLPNTDALGADRVVVLEFGQDVDAEDVYPSFAAA
jgi:hypothetical protein